jgi:hypothetical protein
MQTCHPAAALVEAIFWQRMAPPHNCLSLTSLFVWGWAMPYQEGGTS